MPLKNNAFMSGFDLVISKCVFMKLWDGNFYLFHCTFPALTVYLDFYLPCSFLRRLILLLSSLLLQKDLVSSNFKRAKRGPKELVNSKHEKYYIKTQMQIKDRNTLALKAHQNYNSLYILRRREYMRIPLHYLHCVQLIFADLSFWHPPTFKLSH